MTDQIVQDSQQKKKGQKKAPAKKPAKKPLEKQGKEQQRNKIRMSAPQDKVFVLVNGQQVKNVKELADALEKIEDYVFHHHVTEDKNDFANWLHHVFDEIDLAKEVVGAKDKKHLQLVLYRHISHKLW